MVSRQYDCESSLQNLDILYNIVVIPVTDIIRDDAISDVVWTAYADSLWLGKSESNSHVVRRYIGTRTGTIRLYPGTNLSSSYDPIKRDW